MSPVTVHDVPSVTEHPFRDSGAPRASRTLTSYEVIGEPPSDFGAFHETTTLPSPAIAVAFRGAGGFVRSVTSTISEAGPSPLSLTATTWMAMDPPRQS